MLSSPPPPSSSSGGRVPYMMSTTTPSSQPYGSPTGARPGGNFLSPSSQGTVSTDAPGVSQSQAVHPGEAAGRTVDKILLTDSQFPSLVEKLRIGGAPTLSGLHESDYPSVRRTGDPRLSESCGSSLCTVKNVPLPAELVEHFGHMQCNCMMGIFPGIARAWLTIDSDIYVWKYENCSDLAYFDGLGDTILSVGLMTPKSGIFQDHIKYLLCLTTAVEIVLLGVSFSYSQDSSMTEEMHLLPEPLYTLPTDSTFMLTLACSSEGRIFMGGKDGSLYEFAYSSESGWFGSGRKATKINHSTSTLSFLIPGFISFSEEDPIVQLKPDDSRKILYSRSEKGTIGMYDLGIDGQGLKTVVTASQNSIVSEAVKIASNIDKSNFYPIVDIFPITISESPHINLVAVTKSGVRFYFSAGVSRAEDRPSNLILQHVRLPPGYSASSSMQKPTKVHMSYHSAGSLLLACSPSDNSYDILFLLSGDGYPFQSMLMESQSVLPLDGHSWAMTEIPQESSVTRMYKRSFGDVHPPLMAVQHGVPPRRFVLLSAKGTHIVSQMRPVDAFRRLLSDHGEDGEAIKSFFSLHGEAQACAIALILACSDESLADSRIAEAATRIFFTLGGEPSLAYGNVPSGGTNNAQGFHPHVSSTPANSNTNPVYGFLPEVQYSGKHNGLYLYYSRIIRPVWLNPIASQNLGAFIESDELDWIIHQLRLLHSFMEKNAGAYGESSRRSVIPTGNFPGLTMNQIASLQHKTQQEVLLRERQSLHCLQQLINHSIQVLGLIKVACDHQFSAVTASLSPEEINTLKSVTYRDLIIAPLGKGLSNRIVQSVINLYLNDNASTDAISTRLRDVCPSLYNTEDAISSKAHEILIAAKAQTNPTIREKMVKESLTLCKDIAAKLNLEVIVSHLTGVHCFHGVVEICLAAASKRDPQGLALHYYKNNEPAEDQQGLQAYITRLNCYKYITEMLRKLLDTSSTVPGYAPGVPHSPGPPPPPDPNRIPPAEAGEYAESVLQTCLRTEDQCFHAALYQWLVEQKHYERLLEIKSPYLEEYLNRGSTQHPESMLMSDLLWKHYEKTRSYAAAAKILAKLAEQHNAKITLKERLEYLSRAIMCVKSGEMGIESNAGSVGELLHDLEEKMEVARVQLQILDALNNKREGDIPNVSSIDIARLNSDLLDISTLYQDFAEPCDLSECQLSILHCAGHADQMLVETLWDNIIDKETSGSNMSAKSKIVVLSNKIKCLGRLYATSQNFFPLEYIIKKLEIFSCISKEDYSWVFSSMMAVGISMPKLLVVYNKLVMANDPIWFKNGSPNHLLIVLSKFLNTFAESSSSVSYSERRSFAVACQDAVVSYLGQLYTKPDSTSGALVKEFKCIQSKLERL